MKGTYTQSGTYPAWEFRKDSPLRDTMVRIYQEMFGKEPQVLAIHAGLECGLLGDKLPGLDCVSIGPQMHDIHWIGVDEIPNYDFCPADKEILRRLQNEY